MKQQRGIGQVGQWRKGGGVRSVSFRIPDDLLEAVRACAARHHRSLNGEVLAMMEEYVAARDREEHPR